MLRTAQSGQHHKPRRRLAADATEYPSIAKPVLWLLLGFVLFAYLQGGIRIPALGELRFELIVGTLLAVCAVFYRVTATRVESVASAGRSTFIWAIALLAFMLIYVAFSVTPSASWKTFVDRCFKFALMGFMISALVTTPYALRLLLATYLLAFLKMGQEGVLGYFTGSLVWENQGTPRLHGSTPNYVHPNSFAGTQLSTIPIAFHLWPISTRWIRLVLACVIVAALIVTMAAGSRTAYVAIILWTMFTVSRSRVKLKAFLAVAVFAAIVPYIAPPEYLTRFETIFSQKDVEGASIDARKEILRDAVAISAEYPLGVGLDAFIPVRTKMFGRVQDTHNLYLQVLTNLGVIGFAVFVGFVVSIWRLLLRIERTTTELGQRLHARISAGESSQLEELRTLQLVGAAASGLLGFLIVRLALGLFGHDLYERYWWFVAGAAIALARILATTELRLIASTPAVGVNSSAER